MLMFNGRKTEVLLIQFKYMYLEPFRLLKIGNDLVHIRLSACKLDICFDKCFTMEKRLFAVSLLGFFHLRNIVKCYLTENDLLMVTHAFITSKVDYCN